MPGRQRCQSSQKPIASQPSQERKERRRNGVVNRLTKSSFYQRNYHILEHQAIRSQASYKVSKCDLKGLARWFQFQFLLNSEPSCTLCDFLKGVLNDVFSKGILIKNKALEITFCHCCRLDYRLFPPPTQCERVLRS